MPRFYASAALWITLTLVASCFGPDWVFAASPADATDAPEKTVPQGADPPGADNGDQPTPPLIQHKGVIPHRRPAIRASTRKLRIQVPDMRGK
jgi:hypothetical protein